MLNRETFLNWLRIDHFERKTQKWKRVSYKTITEKQVLRFTVADGVLTSRSTTYSKQLNNEFSLKTLRDAYPLMDKILSKYKGKLIVAGGAIVRSACASRRLSCLTDLDFFFIGCSKDEIDAILREIKDTFFGADEIYGCIRSLNATTFIMEGVEDYTSNFDPLESGEGRQYQGAEYQFIHSRSYHSPMHVIGGFDITVGAWYYDGEGIYGTLLASISLLHNFNIVDAGRRSLTYEQRLRKYSRLGIVLIFPFFDVETIVEKANGDGLAVQRVKVEVVKGLELWVSSRGSQDVVLDDVKTEASVGDYGPVVRGLSSALFFNTVWASKGKWDALTWSGKTQEDLFDEPFIDVTYPNYFNDTSRLPTDSELLIWIPVDKAREMYKHRRDKHKYTQLWQVEANNIRKNVRKSIRKMENYLEEHKVRYLGPDENPGRQGAVWTSSFNPVEPDLKNYYSSGAIISQLFVSNEVAFLLKCMMGPFYQRDVFRTIIFTLAKLIYKDAVKASSMPKTMKPRRVKK